MVNARLPSPAPLTAVQRGDSAPLTALVLPTNLSYEDDGLLPFAFVIAERTGAAVHLVHVLAPDTGSAAPWREQHAMARLASTRIHYRLSLLGRAPIEVAVLAPGDARGGLAAYVERQEAGLVLVLGSVQQIAGRVAAASYPVLSVPPGHPTSVRRLVSDGAPDALAALLGGVLSVPVVTFEGAGAYDFRTDALLVA